MRCVSALLALCVVAGCASHATTSPASKTVAPAHESLAKGPDAANSGNQDDWQKRADEFSKKLKVAQEEAKYQSSEHYRLADRYYKDGELAKAEAECHEALRLDTDNLQARALLWEVQVLQGRGTATPLSEQLRKVMDENTVRQKEISLTISDRFAMGRKHYDAGEYEMAEQDFRLVIEYAKWVFPPASDIDQRKQQAIEMLENTKQAKKNKDIDDKRLQQRLLEEEQARAAAAKAIEQKKELEIMFGMAQTHFEREEYERCADMCDRILWKNPNLTSVYEMKMVAQRLKLMRSDDHNLQRYIYEFQKAKNNIEWLGALPSDMIEFPDRDTWNRIRERKPPELTGQADSMSQEDKQIQDKLKAMRFGFEFQDKSLVEVRDYLREITGVNFWIDKSVEDPSGKKVNVPPIKDISVHTLLTQMILDGFGLTYYVENGMAIIATKAAFDAKKLRLEIYDVQDLTYKLPDMPGKEIGLTEEGVALVEQPGEAQPAFGLDDLVNLIKDTIGKNTWEGDHTAQPQNGLIIIKQTPEIHEQIRKFLHELRASTGILVNMQTRFLWVTDNFLQQIGMDFRDLKLNDAQGDFQKFPNFPLVQLNDLLTAPVFGPQNFVTPGPGSTATTPGIIGTFGQNVRRNMGARVQNLMVADFLSRKFLTDWMPSVGGGMLQYTLIDSVSLEAIVRLVNKSEKGTLLTAPALTLFNTQRGHMQISNQMAYVKDWNIAGGGVVILPDPIIDIISDGIILDVKPIVSADRKYITCELRPTVASLVPAPPDVNVLNITVPGLPVNPLRFELPVIHMQKLKTTVVMPDQGTLLIGGMTSFMDIHSESGVPVWKNFPLLGQLGSENIRGKGRHQLLIFVTARIIIPTDEEKKKMD